MKYLIQIAELSWGKTIVIAIVGAAVYYYALFNDGASIQANIAATQTRLADAKKSLAVVKNAVANADAFEKEVKEANENLARVVEFMPSSLSVADLTTLSTELSNRSGARLLRTTPSQTEGIKTAFYDTVRLKFVLEGTFAQVQSFLSYQSRVSKLMTFEGVELAVSDKSADIETPKLNFEGTLVAYRYQKPAQTAPAAGAAK